MSTMKGEEPKLTPKLSGREMSEEAQIAPPMRPGTRVWGEESPKEGHGRTVKASDLFER